MRLVTLSPAAESQPLATPRLAALRGRAAIANAKLAYRDFLAREASARWRWLAESHGARPQRLLWASTSTKNPAYRDVLYVEELIGAQTVNTLPPETVDAFRDHGRAHPSIRPSDCATLRTYACRRRSPIAAVDRRRL